MNLPLSLRYLVGRLLSNAERQLLSRRWFPLYRRFLGGRIWLYDVCRFGSSRDFRMVFDVGSNVGNVTHEMTLFFPGAEIHAFEPVAGAFAHLQHRFSKNVHVHSHQVALAEAPGEAWLKPQANSELNSLNFQASKAETDSAERVTITTVDEFCTEHRIDVIDILKIDAQGYDLAVVRGAAKLVANNAVCFVLSEATMAKDDPNNQDFAPLHDYLTEQGFQLCGFYDSFNWGPRGQYLAFFNVLYVHPVALTRLFPDQDTAAKLPAEY